MEVDGRARVARVTTNHGELWHNGEMVEEKNWAEGQREWWKDGERLRDFLIIYMVE